jgi:hypothetical protein
MHVYTVYRYRNVCSSIGVHSYAGLLPDVLAVVAYLQMLLQHV